MKKSVLDEMVYFYRQDMKIPQKIQQRMTDVVDAIDSLKTKLPENLAKEFAELMENVAEYWTVELDFYAVECFKLGLLAGIECMDAE